jgi:hypothetical protein
VHARKIEIYIGRENRIQHGPYGNRYQHELLSGIQIKDAAEIAIFTGGAVAQRSDSNQTQTKRRPTMLIPKDEIHQEYIQAWRTYLDALEKALNQLDADIREASEMAGVCTAE